MINNALKTKFLRKEFNKDHRLRVENFLESSAANDVRAECLEAPYDLVYVHNGATQTTSKEAMAAMSASQKTAVNEQIKANARKGIGFLYESCHLGVGRPASIGKQMVSLYEQIKSDPGLELIRQITGDDSIVDASGHFTRYQPGHFLTRHRDVLEDRKRRFAYVLSFTPQWHPDWGGLLQFYEDGGTPRDAWAPVFNSLTLFDVRHVHAVTYVTPFAPEPRLSLTGWFKAQ